MLFNAFLKFLFRDCDEMLNWQVHKKPAVNFVNDKFTLYTGLTGCMIVSFVHIFLLSLFVVFDK